MSIDDQLDAIYYEFDDHFTAGNFAAVDVQLAAADPEALGPDLAVGMLSAARAAREYLPSYAAFRERCRIYYGPRAESMLWGL